MKLHTLSKVVAKSKKRVGRGLSSGKGKTAGRGTKGQKARGKVPPGFIGGTLPLYKKLPYRRGIGNARRSVKMVAVSLSKLNVFAAGETVDLQGLVAKGLVSEKRAKSGGVKITGEGELERKLLVKLPVTASAAAKIAKVGGEVARAW